MYEFYIHIYIYMNIWCRMIKQGQYDVRVIMTQF